MSCWNLTRLEHLELRRRFFKTPGHPLARHNAFLQREGGCLTCSNIGFLYCQNCTVGGPAQHIFQGAVDRALAALDLEEPLQMFRPLVEAGVIVEEDVTECVALCCLRTAPTHPRAARAVSLLTLVYVGRARPHIRLWTSNVRSR